MYVAYMFRFNSLHLEVYIYVDFLLYMIYIYIKDVLIDILLVNCKQRPALDSSDRYKNLRLF